MATSFFVKKRVVGDIPEIEISSDEFSSLERAKAVLTSAIAIEEKYEILVSNLFDLEMELLRSAAHDMLRSNSSYSDFFETRSILNTRIVNLLTSARLYVDQLPQDVAECRPESNAAKEQIRRLFSQEYENCFEYRFMEALRNHVQHSGIPIHLIRRPMRWTSTEADGLMEFSVDCFCEKEYLEADRKFKRTVLDQMPTRVNLKVASRRYIESLSAIHCAARQLIANAVSSARAAVEQMNKRYGEINSGDTIGLAAYAISDDGKRIGYVPLLLDWDDVRIELERRNMNLINLAKRYVTGTASKDK